MYSKKRNEPDGQLPPSSLPPKRLLYMQHPEAESGSSLHSEVTCFAHPNFAAPYADAGVSTSANYKHAVAVGKRSCMRTWRTIDVEECSKRSRKESSSDATVSGVTFQKDLTRDDTRKPDAESDAASVGTCVSSCHDSVWLNSRRSNFVRGNETKEHAIRCNDADKHAIYGNETDNHAIRHNDADKHVSFICSRVQGSRGSMLSVARQGISETGVSSISCWGESRDGSYSNSRNTSFRSRIRDLSDPSITHLRKADAETPDGLGLSKHVAISSRESLHAPFLNVNTTHPKGSSPTYVLSSGRLSLEEGKSWFLLCTIFTRSFAHIPFVGIRSLSLISSLRVFDDCREGTTYSAMCDQGQGTASTPQDQLPPVPDASS